MTAHRIRPLALPEHWTPAEALAVFEMIDLLRDQIWSCYGHDIQQELREHIGEPDLRQGHLPFDPEPQF